MIFAANMKTRMIEDDENREYTYREFMELLPTGFVDDYTVKTERLINYDGDWDALEKFYAAADD